MDPSTSTRTYYPYYATAPATYAPGYLAQNPLPPSSLPPAANGSFGDVAPPGISEPYNPFSSVAQPAKPAVHATPPAVSAAYPYYTFTAQSAPPTPYGYYPAAQTVPPAYAKAPAAVQYHTVAKVPPGPMDARPVITPLTLDKPAPLQKRRFGATFEESVELSRAASASASVDKGKADDYDKHVQKMRNYIHRAFMECPEERHDALLAELNQLCKPIMASSTAHLHDWDAKELPLVCRRPTKKQRNAARKSLSSIQLEESDKEDKKDQRARRFQLMATSTSRPITPDDVRMEDATVQGALVGTNESLEKEYLRLTDLPDPAKIRPLRVLRMTFAMLQDKIKQNVPYKNYLWEQFKSLRQDLTVQHINNEFTVQVYEENARLALANGDVGEYNQCQTRLKVLYATIPSENVMEFTAYRLLYFVYTKNTAGITTLLSELTSEQKEDPAVQHAVRVRAAHAINNYHTLFKLYAQAPFYSKYLMQLFMEGSRIQALHILIKSYRNVNVEFAASELGYTASTELLDFLSAHGIAEYSVGDPSTLQGSVVAEQLEECVARFQKVDIKGQLA